MLHHRLHFRSVPRSVLLAASILVLPILTGSAYGSIYFSLAAESRTAVTSPPVFLESGTAGNSVIYTNNTSAKVTTAAPAPTPTYNASSYNIVTGAYVSGSVPASIQNVDTDYFVVQSSGTASSTTAYNPSGYNLLGSTTLVSGTTADLASNNSVYMTFGSYISATSGQPLYAHNESTTIGGTNYYLLKLSSADSAGTEFSADAGSTIGRKLMGKFVYQLTGVSSIPASTWTIYYRARKGHQNVVAHGDVDILVRMANGTIRTTIATDVANSVGALATSYSTVSGTYSWTDYTVVDQTDYLEIDYYIQVEVVKSGYLVYLRIDDSALSIADQTRADNVILPSQCTSEVEFTGSSNTETWNQLVCTVDSSWTADSVTVTIQVYNYTLGAYPISGNGYDSYTSSTANIDQSRSQTITTDPTDFRNSTGNWKIKVKGVKATATRFDFKADWVEYKPSYYSEYTVSTEFLFSSMTTNTPTQLNFTVVSEYDLSSVSVTIQVWNYSSSTYVTSGEGYSTYLSNGSNETTLLSINTSPQFYTLSGNAKIRITGVLATTTQYQQKVNQAKLVYSYNSSSNYDYVLKIINNVTDPWKIRLTAYSESNIGRLNNCTIHFRNATGGDISRQIYIESGSYMNQTGPWYDLPASPADRYLAVTLEASDSQVSYVNVYLEILVPDKTTYARYVLTFEIS